jgi:hypothetical protein
MYSAPQAVSGQFDVTVKEVVLDSSLSCLDVEQLLQDLLVLAQIEHHSILRLFGYLVCKSVAPAPDVLQIVSARWARPLTQLMAPHADESVSRIRNYLEMADAVDHLRATFHFHCDLQPKQFVISEEGTACLTSMGRMSKVRRSVKQAVQIAVADNALRYLEPWFTAYSDDQDWQTVLKELPFRDMWALGCTILAVETGVEPYDGLSPTEILAQLRQCFAIQQLGVREDIVVLRQKLAPYLPFSPAVLAKVQPPQLAQVVHAVVVSFVCSLAHRKPRLSRRLWTAALPSMLLHERPR